MTSRNPYRTKQTRLVMSKILHALEYDHKYLTVTDLYNLLDADFTYGALRMVIKTLVNNSMVVRKQRGRFNEIVPTQRGRDWYRIVIRL